MFDLNGCRLYGILDLSYVDLANATDVARRMVDGHVDVIQLRGKNQSVNALTDLAAKLHLITSEHSIPLIVNDYATVAKEVAVEGVHVGQDDDAIALAREKAGRHLLIGKSTHSLAQARAAQQEGADYIGFGPIFATPTKPDYAPIGLGDIAQVYAEVRVPTFCIGGININNLQQVIDAGARRVVMVSALLRAHSIIDYARCATDMLG